MVINEWLDTEIQKDIWEKKYRHNNETLDEFFDRVSIGNNHIKEMLINKRGCPGGRILASVGIDGRKVCLSNCFIAGQKVITRRGLINIEDVLIGDSVMTEDGSWQKVNHLFSREYNGDLYKISSPSLYDDIICTPNHKIKTDKGWKRADRIFACSEQIRSQDKIMISEFNYPINNISIDFVDGFSEEYFESNGKVVKSVKYTVNGKEFYRHNNERLNRYATLDDDMAYLIGRWLGDGSITTRRGKRNNSILQIVFNATKEKSSANRIIEIGTRIFGFAPSVRETNQNIISVRWEDEILSTWFFNNFGKKCDGKVIPEWLIGNINVAIGLIDADGCIDTHGNTKIVLKNKRMISQLRDTLYLNGINTSRIFSCSGLSDTYYICVYANIANGKLNKKLSKTYHDARVGIETKNKIDNFVYISSIDILEDVNCAVYNLSVEGNHTYTINGAIVHNCFVITPPQDNIESIFDCAKKMARTYSYGGGCGTDLSNLRPSGSNVNNAAKTTTGPVSFMQLFSQVTETIGQSGRRGALMLTLDAMHPDAMQFIKIKSDINAVNKANISLRISNEFMNAAIADKALDLKWTIYDTNEEIEYQIKPKEILIEMAKMAWDMAEPGCLFWDTILDDGLYSRYDLCAPVSTNPCGEQPLPSGGSCLLYAINISEYVIDGIVDYDMLGTDVCQVVRYMNDVLDINISKLPLHEQVEMARVYRQIGIGIMGLADALIKMGVRYGSEYACSITDSILSYIKDKAIMTSAMLATENNYYVPINTENGTNLYNSALLTIAPTGSIGTMLGCSTGIEPIFANYYERKTESLHGKEKTYKVFTPIVEKYMIENNCGYNDLPDYFVASHDIAPMDRIMMQSAAQRHIDSAISSTINLPNSATVEDVYNIFINAWKNGLKGVTIYRDGCRRSGILTTGETEKTIAIDDIKVDEVPSDLIYKKTKLTTGCGSLYFFLGISNKDGRIYDCFCNTDGNSGCPVNTQAVSRLLSAGLRARVPIEYLIKQLEKSGVCPSFQYKRGQGKKLSKGKSCASAMAYEIKKTLKDMVKDEAQSNGMAVCPSCGANAFAFENGCGSCVECGYSKCG